MGAKVESMYVSEIKNHRLHNNECLGDLKFDCAASKKWGLCWRERLACTDCDFVSEYHKLYDEIDTHRQGRKAAKINVAAAVGLMYTPISNKNFREILMVSNIIPPCTSSMQKTSNQVSNRVEDINKESMKDIRAELVRNNRSCGLTNCNLVRVESDACYNNPLFSAGTTPFQAGTQVTYSMIENNTTDKKIVSLFTGNKLCNVASRLRGKGFNIICPNHYGLCTANLAEDAVIGNETVYSKKCAVEVSDYLKISHITTDGDSKAFRGIKEIHGPNVTSLRDVRHLAGSLKRAILKCTFSTSLFSGINKLNKKNRFALDIKARCVAELNQSFQVHNGELYKIKEQMPCIIETIIMCYKGYCGYSCKVNSFVCAGLPHNHWQKSYIARGETFKMTCDDVDKIEKCIKILLGPQSLDMVRFLTSTQKSEAVNRSHRRCNPKNVTHSRNFAGRAHISAHMRNHGFANSALLVTQNLGAGVTPGSTVSLQLKQTYTTELRMKHVKKLPSSKFQRAKSRKRKYELHALRNYDQPIHYFKGIADPQYQQLSVENRVVINDHGSYPKTCM